MLMRIQMIGIDHNLAEVEEREMFSFTRKSAMAALERLKKEPQIAGCVLIVTCNRMELYVHEEEMEEQTDLLRLLCEIKGADQEKCSRFFVKREGMEAVRHLFFLSAGLKSKIMGEDQILTQIKDALTMAREVYAADTVIEVLFRQAITAGKKVKTQVPMEKANFSAAHLALERLRELGFSPAGKKCMVIGNGMMGKITALALKDAGADVTVTVRQYRSGVVEIPEGCKRIFYGERYQLLKECDIVFSATASPNITIDKKEVVKAGLKKPVIFIDLAVPRDIDPDVQELDGVSLYDIDDFSIDRCSEAMNRQYEAASVILEEAVAEYGNWLECRNLLPAIQKISEAAAEDVNWRMGKAIQKLSTGEKETLELKQAVVTASEKVINRMLFSLRDELEPEVFRRCIEILEEKNA